MKKPALSLALMISVFVVARPMFSQRPASATYASSRQVKLQASVTRIDWTNTNAFFIIAFRDATGTITNWAIQIGSPLELERDGWKPSALHIGDAVTVEGTPTRSEARQALAKSVTLTRTSRRLFAPVARRAAAPAAPA